jgi:hypothetical protein
MLASLRDYLPLSDLAKIVIASLVLAVIAPSAVSLAIAGLDRRSRHPGDATGTAYVGLGVAVIAGLIAAGLYALFTD